MNRLAKLRALLSSGDVETSRQGIELARSLGQETVGKLLAGARLNDGVAAEYADSARAGNLRWFVPGLQHVVAGFVTRGAPYPLNEQTTLALAENSPCETAQELRRARGLVLSGKRAGGPIAIDLGVLRGFHDLATLCLVDAVALERTALELPSLKQLVISYVDAFDLSSTTVPRLRSLAVTTHRSVRSGVGPRAEMLLSLEHLVVRSNAPVIDLATIERLHALRTLVLSSTRIRDLPDLPPSLEVLSLSGTSVTDIRPLVRLKKLRRLNLGGVTADWTPLVQLPQLEKLWWVGQDAWQWPWVLRDKLTTGDWSDGWSDGA